MRYIVAPCEKHANIKQVFHEYFNSMKAGHHSAEITCMHNNAINIGRDSGHIINITDIVTLKITKMIGNCFGFGLYFRLVKAYQEDALGCGYHNIPSHLCDHIIYLAST